MNTLGVIWLVAPESETQDYLHKVLETSKEELEFLPVMTTKHVLEGDLLIDYMRDFKRSISVCSACTSKVNRSTLLSGAVCLSK